MGLNIASFNNTTYTATHVAAFSSGSLTSGVLNKSSSYVVDPGVGSFADDFWIGTPPSSPDPSDFVSFKLTLPIGSTTVLTFTPTDGGGVAQTPVGFLVQGVNASGILGEQINGFFAGESLAQIVKNLDPGSLFVFSTANLSPSVGPVSAASLTFSAVPEPATVALLPLMVIALIMTRMPSVRAFFSR